MRQHGRAGRPRTQIEELAATLDEHGFLDSAALRRRRAAHRGRVPGRADAAGRRTRAAPTRPSPRSCARRWTGSSRRRTGPGPSTGTPSGRARARRHRAAHRLPPRRRRLRVGVSRRGGALRRRPLRHLRHLSRGHGAIRSRSRARTYDTPVRRRRASTATSSRRSCARARQDCFGVRARPTAASTPSSSRRSSCAISSAGGATSRSCRCSRASRTRRSRAAGGPRTIRACRDSSTRSPRRSRRSGRRVAFVAGADLAHVGPRFGDPEPISADELQRVEREDRAMLGAVEAGDARGLLRRASPRDGDRRRICGLSPIYALLRVPRRARRARCVATASGRTLRRVVTYASVVFVTPRTSTPNARRRSRMDAARPPHRRRRRLVRRRRADHASGHPRQPARQPPARRGRLLHPDARAHSGARRRRAVRGDARRAARRRAARVPQRRRPRTASIPRRCASGAGDVPYGAVKDGAFEARFSRAAAFQLLALAEYDETTGRGALRLGGARLRRCRGRRA